MALADGCDFGLMNVDANSWKLYHGKGCENIRARDRSLWIFGSKLILLSIKIQTTHAAKFIVLPPNSGIGGAGSGSFTFSHILNQHFLL